MSNTSLDQNRALQIEQIIREAYPLTGHAANGGDLDAQFAHNGPTEKGYHEPLFQTIYYLFVYARRMPLDRPKEFDRYFSSPQFTFWVRQIRSDGGVQSFDLYYNFYGLDIFIGNEELGKSSAGSIAKMLEARSVKEFCGILAKVEKQIHHKIAVK